MSKRELMGVFLFLLSCCLFVVQARAQMIQGYEAIGYAGPIGSDVVSDPLTLQTAFAGVDYQGDRVYATVPVEVDAISLDAAINYATFNRNLLDTTYLRDVFKAQGVADLDGDNVFSQLAFSATQSFSGAGQCYSQNPSGASLVGYLSGSLELCLSTLAAAADDPGNNYSFAVTTSGSTGGTICNDVYWVYLSGLPIARFQKARTKAVGVVCVADFTVTIEEYDGDPLISLVAETMRHAVIGDVLAVAAFQPEVLPIEITDKAAELTALLDDPEGECEMDPYCLFPGAYTQQPLYYREGYSFTPGGAFANEESAGGGSGLTCDEDSTSLACAQIDDSDLTPEEEGTPASLVEDPLAESTIEGLMTENEFDGSEYEGDGCPSPYEIELPASIFGAGQVQQIPMDLMCNFFANVLAPTFTLLAWIVSARLIATA